eukprot:CAMPEP_0171056498 /NCGR_PEP_ID=MMETSP0766_2-20121228/1067_1 /TAXON_ID=439317 /ORGANISM="Gambierdiscus australes, Strain CAWD 149" /LENGTH=105 /DNA_ID=CAMNT_0011511423 /DNA_START=44 /DNA_END=361 /DNA_ORIENTATION=+
MAATTASCVLVGKAARQQGKRERHGAPRVPKHLRREHWCSSLAPVREGDEESDNESCESRSSSRDSSSRAGGDHFPSGGHMLSASGLVRRLKQQSPQFTCSWLRL